MSTVETPSRGSVHAAPDRIQIRAWSASEVWGRYGSWVVTVVNLTLFLCVWELVTRAGLVNPLFLPRASSMFATLWQGLTTTAPPGSVISGSILDHLIYTLRDLSSAWASPA